MNLNSYEYVLMWASECSEMYEHPVIVLEELDFEKANTMAFKYKVLENEGYIICNWEKMDDNRLALKHCTITPKGINYYKELREKKPIFIFLKKIGTLIYGTISAFIGALIALWIKG